MHWRKFATVIHWHHCCTSRFKTFVFNPQFMVLVLSSVCCRSRSRANVLFCTINMKYQHVRSADNFDDNSILHCFRFIYRYNCEHSIRAMANGGDFVQGQFADNFIWGVATASYQIEGLCVRRQRSEYLYEESCESLISINNLIMAR